MIGQTLNQRFRIDSILGKGGMGCVYRATDLVLKREVAIKTIDVTTQSALSQRLQLEAEIIARLGHDRIVRLYDIGKIENGPLYLVMELVDGSTLQRKMPDLTIEEKLRILSETAEALDEAHQLGIIHRDIKPGNILLTKDLHAKLSDFGLALQAGDEAEENVLRGTVPYMAPELFRSQSPSPASDLYGLGIVLYESVTGELPFRGQQREVIADVTTRVPPPPKSINPDIPAALNQIICQLLEKDPAKRPHRAAEVAARLEEIRLRHYLQIKVPRRPPGSPPLPRTAEPSVADFARSMKQDLLDGVAGGGGESAGASLDTVVPKPKAGLRPTIDIISEPLVRELMRIVEDEPLVLDHVERPLAGRWLAELIIDQPHGWSIAGSGGLQSDAAEMARAILALTSSVVAGGTEASINRAAQLIERGLEVRHALSPLVVGRYLAIRELPPGIEMLRKIRRELVVNHPSVADRWMDEEGHLLPNNLPRDWNQLIRREDDGPRSSHPWKRIADAWAGNPDFRQTVLKYSAPWLLEEKAVARFWPEVVEHLWYEAQRRVEDPGLMKKLAFLRPEARKRHEQEIATLALTRSKGKSAAGSGFAAAVSATSPITPEFQSQNEIDNLLDESPHVITFGELKSAYNEAAKNYRTKGPGGATHERLSLGETANAVVLVSTRGGFKSNQVRILGKAIGAVEITVPPLQMTQAADTPIIAAWAYADGSLAVRYRDYQRNEKNLAWSARYKRWFHEETERGMAGLLRELGLDMPTGTASALEPVKLWTRARRWFAKPADEVGDEETPEDDDDEYSEEDES